MSDAVTREEFDVLAARVAALDGRGPVVVPAPPVTATPAAIAHAEELGVPLEQVEGTGAGGTITKSDVAAAAATEPPAEA